MSAELCTHAVTELCCSVILFASSILSSRKLVVAICWCHICLQSYKLYLRVPAYPACREGEMPLWRPETVEMKSCRGGMQLMRKYLTPVTSLWLSGPQSIRLMINVCLTVWAMAPSLYTELMCLGRCPGRMIQVGCVWLIQNVLWCHSVLSFTTTTEK